MIKLKEQEDKEGAAEFHQVVKYKGIKRKFEKSKIKKIVFVGLK